MESELLAVPTAMVGVTTATTPLLIRLAFIPLTTQVIDPLPELHVRVLPADVSMGPPVTLREVTSLAGYESVH